MSECLIADRWLHDTLSAVCGQVYADVAPVSAKPPCVVFSLQDARDVKTVNTVRVLTDATYLVKAVGPASSYTDLEELADAIDGALDGSAAVTPRGAIIWAERERPIRYSEVIDGTTYRHLGGLYRIQVREECEQ